MTVQTDISAPFAVHQSRFNPAKASLETIRHAISAMVDRRQVRRLLDLDHHQLRDIGLEREDVWAALAGPFHEPASPKLAVVRAARSRARMARLLAHRKKR